MAKSIEIGGRIEKKRKMEEEERENA